MYDPLSDPFEEQGDEEEDVSAASSSSSSSSEDASLTKKKKQQGEGVEEEDVSASSSSSEDVSTKKKKKHGEKRLSTASSSSEGGKRARREVTRYLDAEAPPWAAGCLTLGDELRAFADYVGLTREEQRARKDLVDRLTKAARALWGRCEVSTFGSASTGLDWFESDLDLRIAARETMTWLSPQRAVCELARQLEEHSDWATELEARPQARVPIVTFVDARTTVAVDVSFDDDTNGPLTSFSSETGVHRDLALFLKVFLKERGLDKPFTGGLGSYRLCVLIAHYLKIAKPETAALALVGFVGFCQRHDFAPLSMKRTKVSYHGVDVHSLRENLKTALERSSSANKKPVALAKWLEVNFLRARRTAKLEAAHKICAAKPKAAIPPPASY